jgi:hypothetical protein
MKVEVLEKFNTSNNVGQRAGEIFFQFREGDAKPSGIFIRKHFNAGFNIFHIPETMVPDLCIIRIYFSVEPAYENMVVFVLSQPVFEFHSVNELKYLCKFSSESHFFLQSFLGSSQSILTRFRMTAAGIAPKASAMVLAERALL